ncbi:MAG: DNA adenine methylase [Sphingobacteriaceae bacterium]|nr:DNA adenine methylase [Sphingobacteriaceae bacterium]
MKTCIKYWGGKQQLADRVIAAMPRHHCYVEPFFGGGAVFFKKQPAKVEIINDLNDNMVNFYRVVKKDFDPLKDEVDVTLYSEYQYKLAKDIWKDGNGHTNVSRAWSVFVMSHQSFSGNLGASWAYSDSTNQALRFDNVRKTFDTRYMKRLEQTQIFCRDALNVIENTDSKDTFFFVDPPYYNSECGHYDGYSLEDFENLLKLLSKVEGKFLLTSYPSEILAKYTEENGWLTINHEMNLSASTKGGATKTEVFTMNYKPNYENQ